MQINLKLHQENLRKTNIHTYIIVHQSKFTNGFVLRNTIFLIDAFILKQTI